VQIEDPQTAVFQLGYVNLPSANIKGLEGELNFQASKAWIVDASFSYNNAEVAQAAVFTVVDDDGEEFPFPVEKGVRLPLTPEWSGSAGVEFRPEFTMGGGKPYARLDYSFVGSSWNSLAGIESVVSGNPPELQKSYELVNLRLGIEGEKWSGALFCNNLTDERAEQFINNRWKAQRISTNRPRTIGITVNFKF
jgi:outer membrane receptor protein involved in Fe transport